jgi:hypothetical protein
MYDHEPEVFDVRSKQPADLVLIQMGGNDHRHPNQIPGENFYQAYVTMVEEIHEVWPHAIVLLLVCLVTSLQRTQSVTSP